MLYEADAAISVGACEFPSFLAGRIEANALEVFSPAAFERTRGAVVRTRHRVLSFDPRRKRLSVEALDFGSVHDEPYDRLILATGARARRLGVDGEEADGVFPVRTLDDALGLGAWLDAHPVRHAVVAGAGYVGVEVAEALRHRGLRVSILDPSGRALARSLAPTMSPPLTAAMEAAGVRVRAERITRVESDRHGRVASVRTDRGERIGCQLLIVAVGIEPRTELATVAGLTLGKTGALAVDAGMRTSAPSVWACGDLVEVPRVVDGASIHWPVAPVARRTARVAARNAAGVRPADRFEPIAASVGVRAFGIEAAQAGLGDAEARAAGFDAVAVQIEHVSRSRPQPEARLIRVRLVGDRETGRLLGGELVGAEGAALRANVLVPLLRHRATVRELAEDTDLIYNPPIAPSVDPLRVAASQLLRALGRR